MESRRFFFLGSVELIPSRRFRLGSCCVVFIYLLFFDFVSKEPVFFCPSKTSFV